MADVDQLEIQQAGQPARRLRRGPLAPEVIAPPRCPILHRWTLAKGVGRKLMLHHFLPNADDRAEHDHPASFWTLVLCGGYDDRIPCPMCDGKSYNLAPELDTCAWCAGTGDVPGDRMRAGMLRRRAATYRHRTRVLPSGCWTLVFMGRKERPWGFWKAGRWWPWREHEQVFGFGMRCPDEPGRNGSSSA